MKRKQIEVKGAVETREELEAVMGEYARATLALEDARLEKERAILEAREAFEAREPILKGSVEAAFKQLELWARRHPEAFADRKTMELVQGRIGFRTGKPRVSVPRGVDEDTLCHELSEHGFPDCVRRTLSLDKEALIALAAAEDAGPRSRLQSISDTFGIKVVQTERFFAEAREDATND